MAICIDGRLSLLNHDWWIFNLLLWADFNITRWWWRGCWFSNEEKEEEAAAASIAEKEGYRWGITVGQFDGTDNKSTIHNRLHDELCQTEADLAQQVDDGGGGDSRNGEGRSRDEMKIIIGVSGLLRCWWWSSSRRRWTDALHYFVLIMRSVCVCAECEGRDYLQRRSWSTEE